MKLKKLFETPKKAILTVGVTAFSLCFIGAASVFSVFAIAESTSIGKEAAISNAYEAAGVTAEDVEYVETDFDFDDGKFVYEVEFRSKGKKYEYKIGSSNGAIIKGEHHGLGKIDQEIISIEKAKEITVSHAGLSADDVTFTKAKLDKDDGALTYELKFFTETKKYEYEINAVDGTIIKTDIKALGENSVLGSEEQYITVETAQAKALEAANITNATFTKSKLCKDDGVVVYKIEFITETHKYEYELDAVTGDILKSETEAIDDNTSSDTIISEEEAKACAHNHAGISDVENIVVVEFKLKEGKNSSCFEYEFIYNGKEYEYKINAFSGNIVKYSTEIEDSALVPSELIGIDAAKAKALEHAGVTAENATFSKAELDKKQGNFVYEIEFTTPSDGKKYDYKIDAVSGEVTESKVKTPDSSNIEIVITTEEAKQIAIDFIKGYISEKYPEAVITVDEASIVECELDGKKYEIDFATEVGEFEIKVDAVTGEIKGKEFEENGKGNGTGNGTGNGVCDGTGKGDGTGNGKGNGTESGKNKVKITVDDAKAIAKAEAKIDGEVIFTKAKLEKENGVAVYEIEFSYNNVEYEYTINASSGKVMECEFDD